MPRRAGCAGPTASSGVTCGSSRHRALVASEAGADYVAFGAFFPSLTKAGAKYHPTPEVLRDWSEMTVVPCCAIGGITQENCGPLVEAGADFLAVIGAIWSYPAGPKQAVADFNAVFAKYGRALTADPRAPLQGPARPACSEMRASGRS